MEFDAEWIPKWTQHRFQFTSKINATTGIEIDQENHEH